ncbi:DUF805 domain-containing protein [Haemophilus haemoglobinophilus]|nr:DUF805 domain-containing protein [Canicola haemoglobinophilus]MBN6712179.1 DUF805 domain-containing protein [Canicola haemoglobinophilus]
MRRSRLNYIGYCLLTSIIALLILAIVTTAISNDYKISNPDTQILAVTILIYFIEAAIKIGLTYDRLRDMDKNLHLAWFVILPFAWLCFAIAKGTESENQYGPSPAQVKAEEKAKQAEQQALTNPTDIDLVLQKLEINVYSPTNKVESINFQLSESDERLFYQISPENVKKLRKRLEILADRLQDNEIAYGHKYAERRFYIGEQVIFSWRKEIKL